MKLLHPYVGMPVYFGDGKRLWPGVVTEVGAADLVAGVRFASGVTSPADPPPVISPVSFTTRRTYDDLSVGATGWCPISERPS